MPELTGSNMEWKTGQVVKLQLKQACYIRIWKKIFVIRLSEIRVHILRSISSTSL
jgi:hypothetical protein